MWRALVKTNAGYDLEIVSGTEIKWGFNERDEVLFVFGEFDELVVPKDYVQFLHVYKVGKLI